MSYENPQQISFIVMGAKRSGHASVHHALTQHPQLKLIDQEDHGFFSNDELFAKGNPSSKLYEQLCPVVHSNQICGEVSNTYLYHPTAIARINRYNPNIKLIIILRNPADRVYSHWQDTVSRGSENRSFTASINHEIASSDLSSQHQSTHETGYLNNSKYSAQIEYLHQYFNPHQLLFIKSEDLRDDTEVVLYQLFQFLNVPYLEVDTSAQNLGNYQHSISADSYNKIINEVQADIIQTERLLGWDCRDWKDLKPTLTQQPHLV